MSLVARHLESSGIPTVIAGSARDIVEECGVARFLFSDFPLGNPIGRPGEIDMQRTITGYALDLFESARMPRTTVQVPIAWSDTSDWKRSYARVSDQNAEQLRRMGEARRKRQKETGN